MIREVLQKIACEYPGASKEEFSSHPLADFIRNESTLILREEFGLSDTDLIVKGSAGQSNWAEIPWFAIMNPIVTSSTQYEYYIDYLFSADGKRVYLCLGQGVTLLQREFGPNWEDIIHNQGVLIRRRIPEYAEYFEQREVIALGAKRRLGKSYDKSAAFFKEYHVNNLPNDDVLQDDFNNMLKLYDLLIQRGGLETDFLNSEEAPEHIDEKKYLRLHYRVEGRASTKKIKEILGYTCQACGFNFEEKYGEVGKGFIEVHHLTPYSKLEVGKCRQLKVSDFVALCSNCHRMIHKTESPDDIEAFILKMG